MKTILKASALAAVLALGACSGGERSDANHSANATGTETEANTLEAAAGTIENVADNATGNAADALDNQAEAVTNAADAAAATTTNAH